MTTDNEHGLRVQLATALKERDEALAQETYWHNRATEARDALAAANARADAAETNRDHWRGACVKAMVTGEYPVSPHDDDPQIKSLREAAEASFHGQAYAEMAKRARKAEEALAAARRECEGLISSVVHLRLVGTQMATFIEEQMPLFGGASSEFDGEGEPREILKRWRKADKIADKSYGPAALVAPADGEEGK